jgi:hypothetical protein
VITHNWADIMTDLDVCISLAQLWDDPKQNNFDCGWDWREEHMGKLKAKEDFMENLLKRFDEQGWGYHTTIVATAGLMKAMNIEKEKALDMMQNASEQVTRRKTQPLEIERAIEYCYNQEVTGKRFVQDKDNPVGIDEEYIKQVASEGDIQEFLDTSKYKPQIHEIFNHHYDDNDIICMGEDVFSMHSDFVENWKHRTEEELQDYQYICPNPLKNLDDGRKEINIKERKFIIFESDHDLLAKNWNGQSAVIERLTAILPLRMVVYSGNKSLHGWFDATDADAESHLWRFNKMAIRLGADRSCLRLAQPCRTPWAIRKNNNHVQKVIWYG